MELEALLKECCWFPYLKYCKLCIQDLRHVLYAAVMMPKFYKIIRLEKKKNLYEIKASNTASLHRIF